MACIFLVSLLYLLPRQAPDTGHLAVDIIRVGGPVAGYVPPGLGPARGEGGMGVYYASYGLKLIIQHEMCRGIGGGLVITFDLVAVKIHYHHILRLKLIILDSAWLYHKKSLFPVYAAYVSPRKGHELMLRKQHICLINLFL